MRRLPLRSIVAVIALSFSVIVAAEQFLVEAELWIDGEQRGTPTLIIEAGEPANMEVGDETSAWRLEVEVERPAGIDMAPAGSLWLHIGVHQQSDGEWEHLADSILGVPEGETATLSVVDGDAPATPETAAVYLRIKTSRMRPAE
ncbi:MAG: hypothetical protein ACNA7J_01755 [Wenzhouxiangella sp.]